jgi:hypothetical protein
LILAACLALGLLLRFLTGNSIPQLAHVQLRGEAALLALLCLQAVIPIVRTTGALAQVAYWVWLATFPVLVGIALLNRAAPGMVLVAAGLSLNLLVVGANGGMPVMPLGAYAAGMQGELRIATGDFVHVVGTVASRLPWLADAIPLPGPTWLRLVPSAGDMLLYSGVVAFIAGVRSPLDRGRLAAK